MAKKAKNHAHRCTVCGDLWEHAEHCGLPPYAACKKCVK